ncbi:acidic mammalian chitinase-like [Xyrichtys novacula]|uniref:Acidic mammalian chitinase-like n=1 Tax=Xyrichtys novacula TaxID=13765 RepID=A0AAV1HFQ4_XYRNO|nr:acidic mammalian chitinase-like [Xyrichtys novacula]
MWKLIVTAGLCLTLGSLASSRLVCYYDSTAETREGPSRFMVTDIDPNKCTHLMFAFCNINNQNELAPFTVDDIQRYQAFNGLKNRNPLLKTLLAVGGLTSDTQRFSTVVASQQNRAIFIQSAITFLRTFGFDGLNLDWRHPNGAGSQPQDRHGFTLLIQELSDAYKAEATATNQDRLLLTASVSAEKDTIDESYEVDEIAKYLDFINVLTFDFHGPWEENIGHHSPLFKGSEDTGFDIYSNTDSALKYWQEEGAPAEKLNLGVAAYGRAFSLSSNAANVGAPASGPGDQGCYTGEEGLWSVYERCLYLEDVSTSRIDDQKVPYAVVENQWVGFDDDTSLKEKVSYLKSNNLGGAVVWSLDLDDFTGEFCNEGKSPFISELQNLIASQSTTTTTTKPTTTTTEATTTTTVWIPFDPCLGLGEIDGAQPDPDSPHHFYLCDNGDSALKYWQEQGAPAEKLNMGLAAYWRAFSLSSNSTDVGAPASGPGEEGCYTGEEGLWAFYESCLYLEEEDQWVGFDDETSLIEKVNPQHPQLFPLPKQQFPLQQSESQFPRLQLCQQQLHQKLQQPQLSTDYSPTYYNYNHKTCNNISSYHNYTTTNYHHNSTYHSPACYNYNCKTYHKKATYNNYNHNSTYYNHNFTYNN